MKKTSMTARQLEHVHEGASLDLLFKSPTGQALMQQISHEIHEKMENVLVDKLTDEEILRLVHEMRGAISGFCLVGDKIRYARAQVIRNSVRTQLGQGTLTEEE